LIAWLASLVGYPENAAGSLTSGGSLANLSAIITARQAAEIAARDVEQAVVYLTAHAHHCVTKGLRIAGLGECAVRHIQMDDHHRMRPGALDAEMTTDAHAGLRPWLVVASAGTTDTGAVDPLEPIADIAARHRAWFHVDAAYGGMFALCEEGKRRLAGIERSDSVVLDPHKGMLVPFGVGAVLVKDGPALAAAHAFDAHYAPPKAETRQERSPTELSVELSRPFRGLHLWLPLQILGTAPFEAALEEKLLLARYAYEKIRELEGVEVGPEPDLSIFIFRAIPKAGDADAFNLAIERALLDDGRILLSSTVVGGRRYLRFAVLALQTHREAVDRAVELISEKMRALGSAPARC
jgi:glutamate/tyrosine decarboxylase-like PLP-dependent enzyme